MGFLDKLLSSIGGGSGRSCPDCGEAMWADSGELEGRYECHNDACTGWRVYFDEGGMLVDPPNRGKSSGGRTCESCQSSLSGGDSYLPYEDGSNSYAYIRCPSCSHENTQYGFGED
jgi:DNA-directed RNA polymerase subunit RPC12/RpoP